MDITWHAFSLRDGRRGPQLAVQTSGTLSRIIGQSTDLEVAVRMVDDDGTPVIDWEGLTAPGATSLVALDELEQPVWEGMVLRRRATAGQWATLSLATTEAYWDRRYVKDLSYTTTDQATIVAGLLAGIVTDGIAMTVDAPASGMLRDRAYTDDDDKTLLSVLEELSGVDGGPEFTIDLRWVDDARNRLERVVRVRNRLGTAAVVPVARFSMPGNVTDFEYVEDYTSGAGANDIVATSSAQGDGDEPRPESRHMRPASLAGRPVFEERFTPSTSISDTLTLDQHAAARLAEEAEGHVQLTLTANLDSSLLPGRDWFLGDDLGITLTCPRFPERLDADGRRVAGYVATVRALGYEMDFDARELKPILVETPPVEVSPL